MGNEDVPLSTFNRPEDTESLPEAKAEIASKFPRPHVVMYVLLAAFITALVVAAIVIATVDSHANQPRQPPTNDSQSDPSEKGDSITTEPGPSLNNNPKPTPTNDSDSSPTNNSSNTDKPTPDSSSNNNTKPVQPFLPDPLSFNSILRANDRRVAFLRSVRHEASGLPRSYRVVPDTYWAQVHSDPSDITNQAERILAEYGTNLYDAACWQIAMALAGNYDAEVSSSVADSIGGDFKLSLSF
jgi:hypothetical protein